MANLEAGRTSFLGTMDRTLDTVIGAVGKNWEEGNVLQKTMMMAETLAALATIKYMTSTIYDVALYNDSDLAKVDLTHAAVAATAGGAALVVDRVSRVRRNKTNGGSPRANQR